MVVIVLLAPASAQASFPGSNGPIAFEDSELSGVYTIRADGTHRRLLDPDGFEPAWSPDGERIAYALGTDRDTELAIMRADGSHRRIITDNRPSEWEPSWSPTGRRIVYRQGSARNGEGDLYTIRTNGSDRRLLTRDGDSPDWSVPLAAEGSSPAAPEGRIAFVGPPVPPCFGGLTIFTIEPDGSSRTPAQFGCETSFFPSWAPDGGRLAYSSYDYTNPEEQLAEIFVGDRLGTARTRVTDLVGYDTGSAFSPDGNRIAFAGELGSGRSSGLYVVDPSTPFAETRIPHTAGVNGGRPDWSPR